MTEEDKQALGGLVAQLVMMMRVWRSSVMTNDQAAGVAACIRAWALLQEIDAMTILIERDESTIQ